MKLTDESKCLLLVCLLLLTFSFLPIQVTAQSSQLTVEKEQHWETYGVGGTCISGSHNMFLKDVDSDGVTEIITGGYMYWLVEGNKTASSAPLKIWNWDGKNLTSEKSIYWNGTGTSAGFYCIYAADVDGDGDCEIITGGRVSISSMNCAQLGVWSWDGSNLVLESHTEWADKGGASVNSISVSDLDKDGKPEIITGGTMSNVTKSSATSNDTKSSAQLRIWHLNDNSLKLVKSVEWCAAKSARVSSVYASDVNDDDVTEIVTAGYDHDAKNSTGQLRLWKWNGSVLTMEDNEEWKMTAGYSLDNAGNVRGNTMAHALDVGDVDGDGKPEVVTGGFTYDGAYARGQVRVWRWNGSSLTDAGNVDWHTQDINEVTSLSINDVDGDGKPEIVTSGVMSNYGSFYSGYSEMAQLKVWGWDGKTLTLETSEDWIVDEGACAWNVATGEIDNDGVTEIVTVGCTFTSKLCDPDMRIWSVIQEPALPLYAFSAVVGLVAVAAVGTAFLLARRKSQ